MTYRFFRAGVWRPLSAPSPRCLGIMVISDRSAACLDWWAQSGLSPASSLYVSETGRHRIGCMDSRVAGAPFSSRLAPVVSGLGVKQAAALTWLPTCRITSGDISNQIREHALNPHHVVMPDRYGVAVIPLDRDSTPSDINDCAKISRAQFPANAVADFELSRLFAGHQIRPHPGSTISSCIIPAMRAAGAKWL